MIIFEDNDKDNYDFFKNQIDYFKDKYKESEELKKKNHKKWIKAWMNYENKNK